MSLIIEKHVWLDRQWTLGLPNLIQATKNKKLLASMMIPLGDVMSVEIEFRRTANDWWIDPALKLPGNIEQILPPHFPPIERTYLFDLQGAEINIHLHLSDELPHGTYKFDDSLKQLT